MFFVIVSHEMHVRIQVSEDTLTLKCTHPFLNLPFPKSVTQIYEAVPNPFPANSLLAVSSPEQTEKQRLCPFKHVQAFDYFYYCTVPVSGY